LKKIRKNYKKTEHALHELTKDQGQSVKQLVEQLDEMRQIQKDMKENLNGQIIQNVITVVLSADKNNNQEFDDKEMNNLIFRLKAGLANFEGLRLDEDNFRKVMSKNGSNVMATIDIITNFLDDDPTNDENIFIMEKNARPKSTRHIKTS